MSVSKINQKTKQVTKTLLYPMAKLRLQYMIPKYYKNTKLNRLEYVLLEKEDSY